MGLIAFDAVGAGVVAHNAVLVAVLVVERLGGQGGLDADGVDAIGGQGLGQGADLVGGLPRRLGDAAVHDLEGGVEAGAVGLELDPDIADRGDDRIAHPPGGGDVLLADGGGGRLGHCGRGDSG